MQAHIRLTTVLESLISADAIQACELIGMHFAQSILSFHVLKQAEMLLHKLLDIGQIA